MTHRFTNQTGIELIKYFEGFKSSPYICPAGYLTIGYGHKILPQENFSIVSFTEAEKLLRKDLFYSENAVVKYIDSYITDNQFAALVSFTFNLGGASLQRSTLRQKINYGLYNECQEEFLKWIHIAGTKIPGLIKRRTEEMNLFSRE